MIKVTKKGDYGLLMLTNLAGHDRRHFTPLRQIAEESNLPYKFISQIALILKGAGIVESKEGLGGGYRLKVPPKKVSVGKILAILEGPVAPVACLRGKKCKNHAHCGHRQVMEHLAQEITHTLKQYSLADLVRSS